MSELRNEGRASLVVAVSDVVVEMLSNRIENTVLVRRNALSPHETRHGLSLN